MRGRGGQELTAGVVKIHYESVNARNAEILRLYNDGILLKDIAPRVGLASNTVGQLLRRLGVNRPHKPQKLPGNNEDQTQKIVTLWDHGLSASQISERVGRCLGAVKKVLSKHRPHNFVRTRYDGSAIGGSGRSGFAGAMARRT